MNPKFKLGDLVRKSKGSEWHGTVVGTYSTSLTVIFWEHANGTY